MERRRPWVVHTCDTRRRSHGHASTVCVRADGRILPVAPLIPLHLLQASGLYVSMTV
jgi:hypothetical protein